MHSGVAAQRRSTFYSLSLLFFRSLTHTFSLDLIGSHRHSTIEMASTSGIGGGFFDAPLEQHGFSSFVSHPNATSAGRDMPSAGPAIAGPISAGPTSAHSAGLTIPRNWPPPNHFETLSLAGTKHGLTDPRDHVFINGKGQRFLMQSSARPLELNTEPQQHQDVCSLLTDSNSFIMLIFFASVTS